MIHVQKFGFCSTREEETWNIRMELTGVGYEVVNWTEQTQDSGFCEQGFRKGRH